MNKSIALLLVAVLFITSFQTLASAKSNSEDVAESYVNEEFWNTAKITEQDGIMLLSKTTPVKEQANGNARSANAYQHENAETYINQMVLLVPKEGYTAEDVYEEMNNRYSSTYAFGSGNKTESARDSSISIEATLTIYYQRSTDVNGLGYVKLTQVDGGYRQLDRQVMVCSQVVNAGCTGLAPGGREEQSLDHMLDYGETTSWSLAMPSDWVAVAEDGTGFYVGANVIFTLQRKSTSDYTWKLHLINNL